MNNECTKKIKNLVKEKAHKNSNMKKYQQYPKTYCVLHN